MAVATSARRLVPRSRVDGGGDPGPSPAPPRLGAPVVRGLGFPRFAGLLCALLAARRARDGLGLILVIPERRTSLEHLEERLARDSKDEAFDARPDAAAVRSRALCKACQARADERHAARGAAHRRQLVLKRREPVPPYTRLATRASRRGPAPRRHDGPRGMYDG
jgi:hypothetical protein